MKLSVSHKKSGQWLNDLLSFLKELKGLANIFIKNGKLILELLLYSFNIDITYAVISEGISTQVIVITTTTGGAVGFVASWFLVGASSIIPPLFASIFLLRSIGQQIINYKDYLIFKNIVNKLLNEQDEKIKETIKATFMENMENGIQTVPSEIPIKNRIEMKSLELDQNPLLEFNLDSAQTYEEFIKIRMNEEFGLVDHPSTEKIEEIIATRAKAKKNSKTVYYKDFSNKIAEAADDVIDAEIVKKSIKIKIRNDDL